MLATCIVGILFLGSLVVIALAYPNIDDRATRLIVFAIGAVPGVFLVRGVTTWLRHPTIADAEGIASVWVPRTNPPLMRPELMMRTRIPWHLVDHVGVEGAKSPVVYVFLKDGRRARVNASSTSPMWAEGVVEELENLRTFGSN
jgi:hypothetical protein